MNAVFIDTGYLIALESAADQHHARAAAHWLGSARSLPLLVTTSFILDEVVTFLNSRGQHEKAVELGTRLMTSPSLRFIHVDDELFRAGWEYFRSRPDKRYSLTDCISFVVMEASVYATSSPSMLTSNKPASAGCQSRKPATTSAESRVAPCFETDGANLA